VLVDGTFLTGKYRGTLMMAAAVDPKDLIVPMAFALAKRENNESWSCSCGFYVYKCLAHLALYVSSQTGTQGF
jgi:hypothetical protein